MSAEMLLGRRICTDETEESEEYEPTHGLQHDLESFFWVLVHVCISYDGPTSYRQDLLVNTDVHSSQAAIGLRDYTNQMIGSNQSDFQRGQYKESIFGMRSRYRTAIVCSVSRWGKPLLPLITQFYDLLRAAFTLGKYDDLYTDVVAAFDAAGSRMDAEDPNAVGADEEGLRAVYQELRAQEAARRLNDLKCGDKSELFAEGASDDKDEIAIPATPPAVPSKSRPPPSSPGIPSRKRASKRARRHT